MQQFVVAPDRRYRVEMNNGCLDFSDTGGQFDAQWVARGAKGILGPKIAKKLESASRKNLLVWGSVLAGGSILLLICFAAYMINSPTPAMHKSRHLIAFGLPAFGMLLGAVMVISGLMNQSGKGDSYKSSLPLLKIVEATFLPIQSELARRGEPQVARVRLNLISGKNMVLSIPTELDLAMIKTAIPFLKNGGV